MKSNTKTFWIARGKITFSDCYEISDLELKIAKDGSIAYAKNPGPSGSIDDWISDWPRLRPGEIVKAQIKIVK